MSRVQLIVQNTVIGIPDASEETKISVAASKVKCNTNLNNYIFKKDIDEDKKVH